MRELIDALVRSAEREGMELYGVHIYRRGAEPVERRLRSDDRVDVRSVSKTFTSVALGIAEAEGRLALDDPALKYYPELAGSAAPRLDQVTLRHLLMMTSGSPYFWSAYDPVVVPDLAADFFATPLAHEPGTYFRYTGIGPYVAARALRAMHDRRATVRQQPRRALRVRRIAEQVYVHVRVADVAEDDVRLDQILAVDREHFPAFFDGDRVVGT